MTERLHFHFSLLCIGEGNGNPLQCSCLENPRYRGAWWASIYGVTQSRTRLKWLSINQRWISYCHFSQETQKPWRQNIHNSLMVHAPLAWWLFILVGPATLVMPFSPHPVFLAPTFTLKCPIWVTNYIVDLWTSPTKKNCAIDVYVKMKMSFVSSL